MNLLMLHCSDRKCVITHTGLVFPLSRWMLFQTRFICVRSCAMKEAAGPAPWPPLSDADVAPRLWQVEIPAVHCVSSHFIQLTFDSIQTNIFFQDVPCATIQTEGEISSVKLQQSSIHCPPLFTLLTLPFACLRSSRAGLCLWEALQQETLLWPSQVRRAVLRGMYLMCAVVFCVVADNRPEIMWCPGKSYQSRIWTHFIPHFFLTFYTAD